VSHPSVSNNVSYSTWIMVEPMESVSLVDVSVAAACKAVMITVKVTQSD